MHKKLNVYEPAMLMFQHMYGLYVEVIISIALFKVSSLV